MALITWSTHSSYTSAISGTTATSGSIDGLSSGTVSVLGEDFDNTSTAAGYKYADWVLSLGLASASASLAPYVRVWLQRSIDGTTSNYESGSTAGVPARPADLIFDLSQTSGQQVRVRRKEPMPSCRFRPLLQNVTGSSWSSSGLQSLCFSAYYDEVG